MCVHSRKTVKVLKAKKTEMEFLAIVIIINQNKITRASEKGFGICRVFCTFKATSSVVYFERIFSFQSCINEWNEMPDISSRRPMSPDELSVSICNKKVENKYLQRGHIKVFTQNFIQVITKSKNKYLQKGYIKVVFTILS